MSRWRALALAAAVAGCGGGDGASVPPPDTGSGTAIPAARTGDHSSSIAVTADGGTIYVVNPEADSVSVLDPASRRLVAEIPLGAGHVAPASDGSFTPAILPRALALSADGARLYVTGQRSGAVYAIDTASGTVTGSVAVGSEPAGVAVTADGRTVYVACTQDATVAVVDAASWKVTARIAVPAAPWGLAWSPTDDALLVSQFFGDGVTAIDPATHGVRATWALPAVAARGDRTLAHGEVRGVYDLVRRPATD
ncbi:MAG TPA: beta-propeller fold lactonase family protein, partial [Kofleriaceae bacterium]